MAWVKEKEIEMQTKDIMEGLISNQRQRNEVRRTFQKCGLDPYDPQQELFEQHLCSLSCEALYNALIQGNTAVKLLD
jgi:hypothetical protein